MPAVTDDAIVLQAFPYSESSLIIRLLTRRHGVRSVIAKGARRQRTRIGSGIDPFNEGEAKLFVRDGRDLHTLAEFELTRSRRGLGRDVLRFGGASLLAEIVIRTGSEDVEPALFDDLRRALDRVDSVPEDDVEATLIAETWVLIGRLGYAPALDACVACAREVPADEAVAFDYREGGLRCRSCGSTEFGRPLPVHARRALAQLSRGDTVALDRTGAHWQLIDRFLTYHVLAGSRLRSFTFLEHALTPS